ncbi:MAG TPA: response regulator transcription factor [bacterium]
MSKLIAIVDDEPDIIELVSIHLTKSGFITKGFSDGSAFLKSLDKQIPDLVILDLMLPDTDGLEICKYLRKEDRFAGTSVILLTAKGDETDKVLGLELGADDYITKPFSPRELVARVRAVLRRKDKAETTEKIEIDGILSIDPQKYEVVVKGKNINLTSTEFRILKILIEKRGRVFTRDQILDNLWGNEKTVVDRTVDVHIKNLREKLGPAGDLIKNVRGVGYQFRG